MKDSDEELQELAANMRTDWNRRALEDASFYVAFYKRDQPADAFHDSAREIVRELFPEISRLRRESPEDPFIRALEIGCGPGRLMLPMSRHANEIHGVDISEEMISLAAQRLLNVPHAHVQANSGYDLSGFPDGHFSLVYSCIVFQHIPSREIVLNYLLEAKRVLRPGGVMRFQVRGAPPSLVSETDPETWKGCVITDHEVADFARGNGLELVALTGEGTQYLWVTLRKPKVHVYEPTLEAVTAIHDGSSTVPQRGRHAAVTLWVKNAAEGTDLTTLGANINGTSVRGCYLSPIGRDGGCQMNVMLPKDVRAGMAEVALVYKGVVLGMPKTIFVEAVEPIPRVIAIYDAIDTTLSMQTDSGGLKVLIEDVVEPEKIRFRLGGQSIADVDVVCASRVLGQFLFSMVLPPSLSGEVRLSILIEPQEFFGAMVQISASKSGAPIAGQKALSINPGGIVNNATSAALVAAGGLASVYGSFPVPSPASAAGMPYWPVSLAGLSIQFSETQAPLAYVSEEAVKLQVPWETAGQTQVTVAAKYRSHTSTPRTVNLSPFAPGILAVNAEGTGQGVILDDSYKLVDDSNPAIAGRTVVQISCTGLGAVTNVPPTGSPALADPISATTTKPVVMIGGLQAQVVFSGLAPGEIGLYQVNALVPGGTSAGPSVPVSISIGGATSNTVTIAVMAEAHQQSRGMPKWLTLKTARSEP